MLKQNLAAFVLETYLFTSSDTREIVEIQAEITIKMVMIVKIWLNQ